MAAVSVAAAAAVVLGVFSLVGDDPGNSAPITPANQIGEQEIRIGPNGELLDNNREPVILADGDAEMKCSATMKFNDS